LSGSPFAFRDDIEGLRAVAVLSVVGYHFGVPYLTGGFLGVDVFFVISGYLITSILRAELLGRGSIDVVRFYGRRARRLLPALLLMTVATIVAGIFILSPPEQFYIEKSAATSSLYVSNFWLMRRAFDYFAPESALNPFLHTWSLSVEEQFYLVWPAMLLIAFKLGRSRAVTGIMALTAIASLFLCIYWTETRQPYAFYSSPTRAWEFGLGGLASLISFARMPFIAAFAAGWSGAGVLAASMLTISVDTKFPGVAAVAPAFASVAILLGGTGRSNFGFDRLLATEAMKKLGELSYSIYLWHWPIVVYAKILDPDLSPTVLVACAGLTLACAWLSYSLVEHPIRISAWLAVRPLRSLILGAAITGTGAATAAVAALLAINWAAAPIQNLIATQSKEMPAASAHNPSCLVAFTDSKHIPCAFGPDSSDVSIALLGDSHADQLSTPLSDLALQQGWHLEAYLKSSCSVSLIDVYSSRLRRYMPECTAWRESVIQKIIASKPNLVIISQFSRGYIKGDVTWLGEHAVDLQTWLEGLKVILARFKTAGIPVVVIADTPTPDKVLSVCAARADWRGSSTDGCFTSTSYAIDRELQVAERASVEAVPGSWYVVIGNDLCDQDRCPAIRSGTLVYRDLNHITVQMARGLQARLEQSLLPIIASVQAHSGSMETPKTSAP
jgi:peptidoglycan/LPS O-acetylase OafA/YrhL